MSYLPTTPESVLVRIKNKLDLALGISPTTMKQLIDRYVLTSFGKTSSKTHFAKVNTYNELSSFKMTIKVFFKYLTIVRFKKVKIIIIGTTVTDKEVTVTEELDLLNFAEGLTPMTESPRPTPAPVTTEDKNGD